MELQRIQNTKTILKKNKARGPTLPNTQMYLKVTAIKTACYWCKNKQSSGTEQRTQKQTPHILGHLIYDKKTPQQIIGGK